MNALETALVSRLTGGTALTALLAGTASVYRYRVPSSQDYPAVVLNLQGGGDDNDNPTRSVSLLYLVKAVSTTSMAAAGAIDDQIDALLHGTALTVSGWTNFWCMRETNVRYIEEGPEPGVAHYHAGGVYRVRLTK